MNESARLKIDDVIFSHGRRLAVTCELSNEPDATACGVLDPPEAAPPLAPTASPEAPPSGCSAQPPPATADTAARIAHMHEQVRECLRLAESTQSSGLKMLLVGMAHAWLTLAEQMKHFFATPAPERQRAAED
jgi:hypothetical protein